MKCLVRDSESNVTEKNVTTKSLITMLKKYEISKGQFVDYIGKDKKDDSKYLVIVANGFNKDEFDTNQIILYDSTKDEESVYSDISNEDFDKILQVIV